jgi:hypothetical protein
MELVTEPEIYSPSIDDMGKYIDRTPFGIKMGIRCPCAARKDKIYNTHSMFSTHCKTKYHQKWLEDLNNNRMNHYIENEKNKETIENQKLIIAKLEKELQSKNMTIDYLTKQLYRVDCNNKNISSSSVDDLLVFD